MMKHTGAIRPTTIIDEDQILRGLITAFSAGQLTIPYPHVSTEVLQHDVLHTLIEARRRLEPELQDAIAERELVELVSGQEGQLDDAGEEIGEEIGDQEAGQAPAPLGSLLYFARSVEIGQPVASWGACRVCGDVRGLIYGYCAACIPESYLKKGNQKPDQEQNNQQHDTCTVCGKQNSPFERLGDGICNACLSKRAQRNQEKENS